MPDSRFDTESAMAAFSGYEGLIFDAFFIEGEYGANLNLKVQLDHPELFPYIEGGLQTVLLPAGRGWSIRGDGAEIYAEGTKKIRADVPYGVLLGRLKRKELENFAGFDAAIGADWTPYKATGWKGLRFRFDEVDYPNRRPKVDADGQHVKDAKGKDIWEEGIASRVMPTVFLGVKGGPAGNGQVNVLTVSELNLSDEDAAELSDSIAGTDTHDGWVNAGLSNGIYAKYGKHVPDKGVYAALKAGTAKEF